MKPVKIMQTLVSIQGEGSGVGRPILLIRLGGCNLACPFCDSKWANKDGLYDLFMNDEEIKTPFRLDHSDVANYLEYVYKKFLSKYNIKTVLFTGGEPFLKENVYFMDKFIEESKKMKYFNLYEIETNGTLLYNNLHFLDKYDDLIQLNISPKVSHFFNEYTTEFKDVLTHLFCSQYKAALKFVYSNDMESDILYFIKKFNPKIPIYMSSLTPTNEAQSDDEWNDFLEKYRHNCLDTVEFCLKTGYLYSPREHVFLFGANREEFESLK